MNLLRSILMLVVAFGLAPAFHSTARAEDGVLRVTFASPIETLDPHKTSSVLAGAMLRNIYEQLTRAAPGGGVEPSLATDWSVSDDNLTWTFHLRKGVKFHDGSPFNAAAVVRTFHRLLDPAVVIPGRTNLGPISKVEAVDDMTVKIVTSEPFSALPIALTHHVSSILSPKSLDEWGDQAGSHPIAGTGPFKIGDFTLPDSVTLVRNEDYWGEKPTLDKIVLMPRSDSQTRLASLLSGETDLDFYVSPESRGRVEADSNFKVEVVNGRRMYIVHLPFGRKEFQDIRVRKALNLAIDRDQIVKTLFQGVAAPVDAAIGPNIFGYKKAFVYPYDPDKAEQLLKEAGWVKNASGVLEKDGTPFPAVTLRASRGRYPKDDQLAQVISGYLAEIGVPTKLQVEEFGVFFPGALAASKTGMDMVQMGWESAQSDGMTVLCSIYLKGNSYDFGAYDNPGVTKACDAINRAFDPVKRAKLIEDATKAVYEDAPGIYVVVPAYLVGEKKGLAGVQFDPGEQHKFANAHWE
jgi:peptide/nickel transport system substrate-binding protein